MDVGESYDVVTEQKEIAELLELEDQCESMGAAGAACFDEVFEDVWEPIKSLEKEKETYPALSRGDENEIEIETREC